MRSTSFISNFNRRVRRILLACSICLLSISLSAESTWGGVYVETIEQAAHAYKNASNVQEQELFANALTAALRHSKATADGTVYVSTGDIPAEWLRDASAEVRPYLYFAKNTPDVAKFIAGVIARETKYINIDPYANAFKEDYTVWERKYELDSLAYPIMLCFTYWKVTGDASIFTDEVFRAFDKIVDLMHTEQHHEKSSYTHKQLSNGGKGAPVADTGMIWSGFRPSDDSTTFGYLIPSEMMAVVALGDLAEIESGVHHDRGRSETAEALRNQVDAGIQKYGIVDQPGFGKIYAYEVDGFGHALLTDDTNVPSLLAAPYLGYVSADDPIYQNTRRFVLSKENPTYEEGKVAKGIGSYHTPSRDHKFKYWLWPLSLVMQDLTSQSKEEQDTLLKMILASDPGDHLLHESFDPDDAKRLTRHDFAWPNSLFAELVLTREMGMSFIPMGDSYPIVDRIAHSYDCGAPLPVGAKECLSGQLETMFVNGLTNVEHQTETASDGTVFVKTGDIPYEWFRDSSAQVTPYLYFAKDHPQVADFLKRVIERHAKALAMHPYAAAFNVDYSVTWPRYELDSLLYPIQLAWQYWQMTGDRTVFTDNAYKGYASALQTLLIEQNHNIKSHYRDSGLVNTPSAYTGMIWSAFRPSDLGMVYNYNVPGNMMAVVVLKELAQIEAEIYHDQSKAADSLRLSSEVDQGIRKFGIVNSAEFGKVYAYEVDGMGHYALMDDANVPSLLSAPYLGYLAANDPIYQNTRKLLLSRADPFYYSGSLASGIGSNNTPTGTVWPLSLLAQGLTSENAAERQEMIKYLLASDPGDHLLHESFNPNDPKTLTRPDFGWPNSMFAQFIMWDILGYKPLPHA